MTPKKYVDTFNHDNILLERLWTTDVEGIAYDILIHTSKIELKESKSKLEHQKRKTNIIVCPTKIPLELPFFLICLVVNIVFNGVFNAMDTALF